MEGGSGAPGLLCQETSALAGSICEMAGAFQLPPQLTARSLAGFRVCISLSSAFSKQGSLGELDQNTWE